MIDEYCFAEHNSNEYWLGACDSVYSLLGSPICKRYLCALMRRHLYLGLVGLFLLCSLVLVSIGCGGHKRSKSNVSNESAKLSGTANDYSLAEYFGSATPTYLNQGWSSEQRQEFYTTSQGSQMMPLSWFVALERPASAEAFLSDGLIRFGYLANSKAPLNPCGLPIGFTIDPPQKSTNLEGCPVSPGLNSQPLYWVGMTCAACHTGRVNYRGTTLQIDGAPTNADLFKFLAEVDSAVQATLKNDAKFNRFADRVMGPDIKKRHDLKNELTRFSAYFDTL